VQLGNNLHRAMDDEVVRGFSIGTTAIAAIAVLTPLPAQPAPADPAPPGASAEAPAQSLNSMPAGGGATVGPQRSVIEPGSW
jgi:hypothetical protein